MADIIKLAERLNLSRASAASSQGMAKILFFTGIRYERLESEPLARKAVAARKGHTKTAREKPAIPSANRKEARSKQAGFPLLPAPEDRHLLLPASAPVFGPGIPC